MIEVMRSSTATLRIWRALPWSTNPLMRLSDRFEGVVRIVAVIAVLAAIPVAGALGTATYSPAAVHLRMENATEVEVTATITTAPVFVPRLSTGVAAYTVADDRFDAMASWNENGRSGQSTTAVGGDAKPGDRIPLWLDAHGRPTRPPIPSDYAAIQAIATGIGSLLGIWCGAAVAVVLTVRILEACRSAAWAQEWQLVGRSIGQDT